MTEPGYREWSITLQILLFVEIKLIKTANLKVKGPLNQKGRREGTDYCHFRAAVGLFNMVWTPFSFYQRMLWFQFQHWRPLSYFNVKISIRFKSKTQFTRSIYSLLPILIHFFFEVSAFFFFSYIVDFKLLK